MTVLLITYQLPRNLDRIREILVWMNLKLKFLKEKSRFVLHEIRMENLDQNWIQLNKNLNKFLRRTDQESLIFMNFTKKF